MPRSSNRRIAASTRADRACSFFRSRRPTVGRGGASLSFASARHCIGKQLVDGLRQLVDAEWLGESSNVPLLVEVVGDLFESDEIAAADEDRQTVEPRIATELLRHTPSMQLLGAHPNVDHEQVRPGCADQLERVPTIPVDRRRLVPIILEDVVDELQELRIVIDDSDTRHGLSLRLPGWLVRIHPRARTTGYVVWPHQRRTEARCRRG